MNAHCESLSFTSAALYGPWNGCLRRGKRGRQSVRIIPASSPSCYAPRRLKMLDLPWADLRHGRTHFAAPHPVVVGDPPCRDEGGTVISPQFLVVCIRMRGGGGRCRSRNGAWLGTVTITSTWVAPGQTTSHSRYFSISS